MSARGEEALGELAQALLENPFFNQMLQVAFGARDRAMAVQRTAMEAMNVPTTESIDRLERRIRSLNERLERLEDDFDRLSRLEERSEAR
jgi:hypothetical protein